MGVKGFPFFSGGGRGEGEREVKESGGTNEGKEWGDTKESPPPPLCSPLIQLGAACFPECRRRCCPLIGGLSPFLPPLSVFSSPKRNGFSVSFFVHSPSLSCCTGQLVSAAGRRDGAEDQVG